MCFFKSTLIVLLLIIPFSIANAQYTGKNCTDDCSCQISGQIKDASTGEPLSFATVLIKGTNKGIQTDADGKFLLADLCESEYDLVISFLGYKTVTHHHDIYHPFVEVRLAPDEVLLESVVVEGEKLETGLNSVLIDELSSKDLSSVKSESLGEALSSMTGVSTLKTGQNISKPIIHGLHSNRVLIINNGVRHEGQEWGQQHAPEIDPSLADNISLIKGAASVKYGPNALGGVVLINPPALELTSHLHGEAVIRAESNGRALDGNISLQKGYERFVWMAQLASRYQGDLRSANYNLTNTGMRESSMALGTRYHLKKIDFFAYYSHVAQSLGVLRGSVVGNLDDLADAIGAETPEFTGSFSHTINNPRQEVSHDLFKVQSVYNMDNSQLKLQYAFQINQRQEYDVRRGTNNQRPSIDLELFTHSTDLEWIHPSWNGWEGSVGAQWFYQDNNNQPGTHTNQFIPNYNNSRLGIYFVESRLVGKTTYEIGMRYDYQSSSVRGWDSNKKRYSNELQFQNVSGIIGLNKPVSEYASFRTNFATAWRPPNIAELYAFGKHESIYEYGLWRYHFDNDGNPISGNVLTEDERPVKSEVGFKWINNYEYQRNNIKLDVVGYINYIQNYIYTRPYGITSTQRGPFPYFIYGQSNALFYGVDATLHYKHSSNWNSKLAGTYLRAKDVNNDDFFIGIPANQLAYELNFEKKNWLLDNLQIGLEAAYTFKQHLAPKRIIAPDEFNTAYENGTNLFEDDDSNFDFLAVPNGYLLANFKTTVTIKRVEFEGKVKNVLNTQYRDYTDLMRYFADEQGINILFSIKLLL